eukprot:CAMPEP_0175902042 /NCGR_PEP_ID=MMETSP0108-20121206/3181_1 /TAXON_ID=195067 ORGANISM="Goniomonas pacifica, Strain CCMP1869" /NCGR_SAMPLE_ID=MMETSP0108 /ASSEMBLY_ACC=CAM_ASM_000204 /LENGTH=31 /DNA_ID= /DNA_START= /DNA_END= /DNA_ORIENTATION=
MLTPNLRATAWYQAVAKKDGGVLTHQELSTM